jgi:hypothetical protein
MEEEAPIALDGIQDAWCQSALVRGKLALVNLVQTEQMRNSRGGI